MNRDLTNDGGYVASDLRAEFRKILLDENFDDVRNFMTTFDSGDLMRIPTVGEMFGKIERGNCEIDNAEQWELMKDKRNRIMIRKDEEYEWGWLQNKIINSSAGFAYVDDAGAAAWGHASNSIGVRPVFQLEMNTRAKIIAVDFDGTLVENKWPKIGETNTEVLNYCKQEQANGARIILWTNRIGEKLTKAVQWCEENGLRLDAVNDNLQEIVDRFGFNTRKIYADEYIDDRCCIKFKLPFVRGETK